MGVRTSVGRFVGAVVFTYAATCCSAPTGPPEAPAAAKKAAQLGPQPASATEGTYVVASSDRSLDQIDIDATGLANKAGELVELRNVATGSVVYVAVEEGKPAVVRDGWTATSVHADRVWNPAHCANLPHELLGERYIVMLRDGGGAATFELFDLKTKRFVSAPIAEDGVKVFTLSLRAEGAASFSVLADRNGELVRRSVDATHLRYRDTPIQQPAAGRVLFARAHAGGYVVDYGPRKGARVQLQETAGGARFVDSNLALPVIAGRPGQLSVVGGDMVGGDMVGGGIPLSADVVSASIVGATASHLYVAYSASTTSVADAVAAIDRATRAFEAVAGPQSDHLLVVALRG